MASKRRQKKYDSPQSTPVPAANPPRDVPHRTVALPPL
jgi:hypothetical protein